MTERRVSLERALQIFARLKNKNQPRRMAWTCSGHSNQEMVDNLRAAKIISDPRVHAAMSSVDRADFCTSSPYNDQPQLIGYQATISAPHMHGTALEYLKNHLIDGAKALDVGSGSGYLTACMAHMVGSSGQVVGIEHIPQLVELSKNNVNKHHGDLLATGQIVLVEGDGRQGYAANHPYNAIHVGAAAPELPKELVNQLAEGGRMVIPVGAEHGSQVFLQIDKKDGRLEQQVVEHVQYVPLTSRQHQLSR